MYYIYRGEVNFGQLIRQEYGLENVYSIGFTTFQGQITASHFWGLPPESSQYFAFIKFKFL